MLTPHQLHGASHIPQQPHHKFHSYKTLQLNNGKTLWPTLVFTQSNQLNSRIFLKEKCLNNLPHFSAFKSLQSIAKSY